MFENDNKTVGDGMYPMIYAAINAVMTDIGAIRKDSKNAQQGFMFRGIDAVYNALHPALTRHGVFIVPEVLENTRSEVVTKNNAKMNSVVLKVKYTLYAADGSSVSTTVIGEGMDSGDKASNKAMSIAMKYAIFQVFCIPTEEMDDPDRESPAEPDIICEDCGNKITALKKADEVIRSVKEVASWTKSKSGKRICYSCAKRYDWFVNNGNS